MIVVNPLGGHPRPDLLGGTELGTKFGLGETEKSVMKKSASRNEGRDEEPGRHCKHKKQKGADELHDITRPLINHRYPRVGTDPCQGNGLPAVTNASVTVEHRHSLARPH